MPGPGLERFMRPALACPKREDFQRLIWGQLPPPDVDRLTQHLGGCPDCAAALQSLLGAGTPPLTRPVAPADGATGGATSGDLPQPSLDPSPAPDDSAADSSSDLAPTLRALKPPRGPGEIGWLAHYRVLKVLGQGGMGVVFLAEDVRLGRTVALKTMKPEVAADPRHRQRFLREARAAAKVESDYIVPIYDVGEDGGVPWLAMPLLKGQSLNDLLTRVKVLTPGQAARLGAQVAKGLAAAHAAGLIHRDVKPGNIWVEPEGGGRAKLLDFGLARDQSPPHERGDAPLTRTGAVVGTPAFMAPEQAGGQPLDARADLFSLGCVLYRAVTGRLPFQGPGTLGTLVAIAIATPPAPAELNRDVPPPLSALIMKLLAKDRAARPPSAAAVAAALDTMREAPTGPAPVARPEAAPREQSNPWADLTAVEEWPAPAAAPRRWWPLMAAAALLLALGGALAAGIVILTRNKDGQEAARVASGSSSETRPTRDSGKSRPGPADSSPDRRAAEWMLSVGGKVIIRVADKEQEVEAAKHLPAGDFQLITAFTYGNDKVTDAGLAHFEGLAHLTALSVEECHKVTDAGLEHLKGLTSLTSLRLRSTQVTDAGLRHLKGLTNLKELTLPFTGVSGAGFVHLKDLPNLTYLELWGCGNVTGEGLKSIKALQSVNLVDTPIGDAELEHLGAMTNLTGVLDLDRTRVGDAGLAHLRGLSGLKGLGLSGTRVTDAGLTRLRVLRNLQGVNLDGTRVSDAGLADLKALPNLSTVVLSGTRITDAGLSDLARPPLWNLTRLDNTRISAAGFAKLRNALPNASIEGEPRPSAAEDLLAAGATFLVRPREGKAELPVRKAADLPREPFLIRRADCTGVKVEKLAELLGRLSHWREYEFEEVEALDLSGCAIDNLGFAPPLASLQELNVSGTKVADLQPIFGLKRLRTLSLDRTPVSSLGPVAGLAQLEELSLAGTSVADVALQGLEELPNLRRLDLNQTAVTGRDLRRLAKLPKLTDLSLAGSKVTDLFAGEVGALTKLERLSLAGCAFGDAGLKHLAGMSHLTQLDLAGTQITAAGVAGLQKSLPRCKIVSGPAAK
jgi:Leucine-rich repeat (LRR) protein